MSASSQDTDRLFSAKSADERKGNLYRRQPQGGRTRAALGGTAGATTAGVGRGVPGDTAAGPKAPASGARTTRLGGTPPDLSPVTDPLTPAMARHLLRRTGFGARPAQVNQFVGMQADIAVDTILASPFGEASIRQPGWVSVRPPHQFASPGAWEAFFELNDAWMREYVRQLMEEWTQGSIGQRMMLFWHDHFASSFDKYELAAFSVRQMEIFRANGLGRFDQLVEQVGLEPGMLIYLDGFINDRYAPNENYARELLELFTMGRESPDGAPNYDEVDISELARALTGWTVNYSTLAAEFYPTLHDAGSKRIFGTGGDHNYSGAIDLIFEKRGFEIAFFIAGKLFREFVHQEPDHDTVRALAQVLVTKRFSIKDVLQVLLSSRFFFDSEGAVGARVKSPIELLVGMVREYGVSPSSPLYEGIYWEAAKAGQQVFFPPNVAGWTGHTEWLSTSTLPVRWNVTGWFTYYGGAGSDAQLRIWANHLADPSDGLQAFRLPWAALEHLLAVPLETLKLPRRVVGLGGDTRQFPIPDTVRQELPPEAIALASTMLRGAPWYEWDISQPQTLGLLRFFLAEVFRRPEYQLM